MISVFAATLLGCGGKAPPVAKPKTNLNGAGARVQGTSQPVSWENGQDPVEARTGIYQGKTAAEWGLRGRKTLWDADHIVPVIEGGGECDLSNMRTLCLKCHREATAGLRLKLSRQYTGGPG